MGTNTKISWCDSTVNPVVGCDGCELSGGHCYAESLVNRYAGKKGWPKAFSRPEFVQTIRRLDAAIAWKDLTGTERPNKPWLNGLPRLIFVCDLSDPFSESLPIDWLSPHVDRFAATPHIWMLLTKRPKRMAQFVAEWEQTHEDRFPQNIWGGTSVTSQATTSRIGELLAVPSLAVRFLSLEPLLGPIEFTGRWHATTCPHCGKTTEGHFVGIRKNTDEPFHWYCDRRSCRDQFPLPSIDWVIVGGESGRKARPMHPDWVRSVRNQCQAAGVPFFFKQWGEWFPSHEAAGYTTIAWPECKRRTALDHAENRVEFERVGKKRAGRLLDGREWTEFPQA